MSDSDEVANTRALRKISVVIPVYNSVSTLAELVRRLNTVLTSLDREFELVLVDDCSPDGSWRVLTELKLSPEYGPRLKIAALTRNSGQHNALLCGLTLATGGVIVTMDDDLQNPPEELPRLVAAVDAGFDLAIAAYEHKQHSAARNASGGLVDGVLRRIFKLPRGFQLTSFRAVSRAVVANVIRMGGAYPYVTSMLLSHTSSYVNVMVRHDPRPAGRSNYSIHRSTSLALNLILHYSSYPVYALMAACALAMIFSLAFSSMVLVHALVNGSGVPGWASTVIIISCFNTVNLLGLLVFGLYLSRILQQITHTRVNFTIGALHE